MNKYTLITSGDKENSYGKTGFVKADGSFDSAIIDPYGRILALDVSPNGGEATLVAEVRLGSGKGTLSTMRGNWTGWLALAGMIFFGAAGKRLEKK